MDKDRVAGSVNKAKLQADGRAGKAAGTVQNAFGGMKDAARKILNK